jgi:hypothetical protein
MATGEEQLTIDGLKEMPFDPPDLSMTTQRATMIATIATPATTSRAGWMLVLPCAAPCSKWKSGGAAGGTAATEATSGADCGGTVGEEVAGDATVAAESGAGS